MGKAESVVVLLSDVNELNRSSHDLSQNEIIINSNNNMGGQSDLSLSSHRKDDESFNTKRKELQQFLPQLEQHLTLLTTSEAVECIWRSTHFRNSIRQKLTETLQEISPAHLSNLAMIDPEAIEAHVFANSKSKDEYLELTARVIIHFKNLNEELLKENSSIDNHKNVLHLQLPSNSMENKQGNNNVHTHCAGQKPMKRAAESSQSNHQYVNEGQPERKRFQQDE